MRRGATAARLAGAGGRGVHHARGRAAPPRRLLSTRPGTDRWPPWGDRLVPA